MPRSQTVRAKIILQADKVIQKLEECQLALKKIDTLCAGRSPTIDENLPVIVLTNEMLLNLVSVWRKNL